MDPKIVYLMRGLPGCGKSHRARELAGATGRICETDQFFYTQVGEDPHSYDFSDSLLDAARDWNFNNFREALSAGVSPIVVDRGNGLNVETQRYAQLAVEHDYRVALAEPDSAWWQELRVLLKYKQFVDDRLFDAWAEKLSAVTRDAHRVPAATIRRWMSSWRFDLTVDEILSCRD